MLVAVNKTTAGSKRSSNHAKKTMVQANVVLILIAWNFSDYGVKYVYLSLTEWLFSYKLFGNDFFYAFF